MLFDFFLGPKTNLHFAVCHSVLVEGNRGRLGRGVVLQRTAEEERRWIRRKTMTMTCMKSEERKKERKDGSDEASKKATKVTRHKK